ncbi:hypothetical protein [Candidatus Methylobacter oryzae]|uniref:Uncharacterized protein n=1 Tax=Candidatus Methylobacter oryzae TaxID=2497749 RepID=A0ABY3CD24_9GAMM|nr:hypothetical protein [Candidatus Methylobacter oryzae]TRW94421.1 hypothetical protein EKO24_011785 [Candidatus Methylobacter oryzae]
MTLKKRGLGRGLEALLAEDFANEEIQLPIKREVGCVEAQPVAVEESVEVNKQAAMVVAFFKEIQKEHHTLLEEAENLRKLIEDFESIIRADLS